MRSTIKTVTDRVAALRLALLAPSADELQLFVPILAEAAGSLSTIQQGLSTAKAKADPEVNRDLEALKRELRAVRKLIDHGAMFWEIWGKLFGAATGGYTPAGEPRPVAAIGTISVEG
jgi:hypothetical protein